MTLEEYKMMMNKDKEWAPGWLAIDEVFENLYPNQNPAHFGTLLTSRAVFGGNEHLDGFSIYESPNNYKHLVTYGMTNLYSDENYYGEEWSGWGYEMTIKLKEDTIEDCKWAISVLSNLARYTYNSKGFFEAFHCVPGDGSSLHIGVDSSISGVIFVKDTEAQSIDTVHGKVDFIQLVGITTDEANSIKNGEITVQELVEIMKKDNPYLITDMKRNYNY